MPSTRCRASSSTSGASAGRRAVRAARGLPRRSRHQPARRGRRGPAAGSSSTTAMSDEDRDLGHLRANSDVMLHDDADQQPGHHRAEQRAHAADHGDHEGLGQHRARPSPATRPADGAASTPASPASPVPRPKTSSQTRATSTPSTRTMSGSRAPARMMRPKRVRSRTARGRAARARRRRSGTGGRAGRSRQPISTAPSGAPASRNGIPLLPKRMRIARRRCRQAEGEQQRVVDAAAVERAHQEALGQHPDGADFSWSRPKLTATRMSGCADWMRGKKVEWSAVPRGSADVCHRLGPHRLAMRRKPRTISWP